MEKGPPDNTVALVTGGYKNLGREISKQLKDLGHRVIATYRTDMEKAERTSRELGIEVHHADMSDPEDVSRIFSHLHSRGLKVSVLVNNISTFPVGSLMDIDLEDLDMAYRTTFRSALIASREAIVDMKDMGWGRIVNISMAGTSHSRGYRTVAAHASMKAALNVITLSLAEEMSDSGITINGILPGIIDRPEHDDGWRREMKDISQSGELTTDRQVAIEVMNVISNGGLNGRLIEVV